MKAYLDALLSQLSERERLLLFIFGPLLMLVVVYSLIWRPFEQRVERLEQRTIEQQEMSKEMMAMAIEVGILQRQSGSSGTRTRQSLLSLVDKTIRQAGLSKSLKRVDPDGSSKVNVRIEDASFDAMIKWLEGLQRRHAVTVKNISIDRQEDVGVVNVRLTLVGAD